MPDSFFGTLAASQHGLMRLVGGPNVRKRLGEQVSKRKDAAKGDSDPTNADCHKRSDLKESAPNRARPGLGHGRVAQSSSAKLRHEDVSQRGQPNAELVRTCGRTAGAVTEQVQLLLFDAVLHLATLAVLRLVQGLGSTKKRLIRSSCATIFL